MAKITVKSVTKGESPCPSAPPKPGNRPSLVPTDPPRRFPPPPAFFFPGPCCPGTTQVVDNIKVVSLTPDTINVQEGVVDGQKAFGISCNASTDEIRIEAGKNVTIDSETSDKTTTYTVNADIEEFTGATDTEDGTYGTVPAPTVEDKDRFLKGDGTWGDVIIPEVPNMVGATAEDDGEAGIVPAPQAGDQNKYLSGDASWKDLPEPPSVFVGATEQANGTQGLVPAPTISNRTQFLCGDGSWKDVDNTRECTALEIDTWITEVDNEVNNG